MNETLYSITHVAFELGTTKTKLRYKATSAGVEPVSFNRNMYFTFAQIDKIRNHKLPRKITANHEKFDDVITYFKTNKDNRTSVIAEHFNIGKHQVSNIIDTYYAGLKPK